MSVVRAKQGLSFDLPSGEQVNIKAGQPFPADHPHVRGREEFFEPMEDAAARISGSGAAVETATAVPGERRSVVRKPQRGGSEA